MLKSERTKLARKEFKKPVTKFQKLDLSKSKSVPKGMTRAYRNNRFTVMVYDNHKVSTGTVICVLIQKHDDTPINRHWFQLQKIKNEIFGKEAMAIEYYPPESKLIDDHNIYWIWIFPEGVLPIPIF